MDQNPYAAPESDLKVETRVEKTQFYVVSIQKFTVLFLSSLGFYTVYWFYRNWKQYRDYTGQKLWPVARAIFSIFFAHRLFAEVDKSLSENGRVFRWLPAAQATAYVVLSIISKTLDRLAFKEIGSPYTDALSLLILPFLYFALITPQRAINHSQGDPDGSSNNNFTTVNYVWIVIGIALWALSLLGLATSFALIDLE